MNNQSAQIAEITMSLDIHDTPEAVWRALTDNIGQWWPAEFYAGGDSETRTFSLETRPGGRMFESWDNDGGVLWGTVIGIEPNSRLQVSGLSFPNWGGPSQWFGTWELTPANQGTTLTFSESVVGRVSDAGMADKDKGWKFLWRTLKAHIEGKPAPVWTD